MARAVANGLRQRLFAIHVLPRPARRDRHDGVPMLGRGDYDCINVRSLQELLILVVRRAPRVLPVAFLLGVVLLDFLLRRFAGPRINIADRDDLHSAKAQQVLYMRPAHLLEADDPQPDPLRGRGPPCIAQRNTRQNARRRQRRTGVFQELAS